MITNDKAVELLTRPDVAEQTRSGLQALFDRSATDPVFRRKLVETPTAALEEFHGHTMPAGFNVVFVENHHAATIVLPDAVDAAAELSEEELQAVAGGMTPAAVTATWVPSLNVVATVLSVIASVTYWLNSD